jgi:predicted Zn-dependent protease with MMP-like domain
VTSPRRDRRGRGSRGPDLAHGPLAPHGVPRQQPPGARFDALAVAVLDDIEERWHEELPPLDLAVEEVPVLPDDWSTDRVPLGSLVPATATTRARIVLFRRPIEHRADDRGELAAIVLTVLVDQVAELIGVPPSDLHPDYPPDD